MGPTDPAPDQHWIVGFDGSAGAEHALHWCISQSRHRSAAIEVVRAWHPELLSVGDFDLPSQMDEAPKAANVAFTKLAGTLPPVDPPIQWSVQFGDAAKTLLHQSKHADLLVVGTRGKGGFKRLLLGSVSHQCATHASVPVAVIPDSAAIDGQCRHLVVGMDGSDNAKSALRWALKFAPDNATVFVVGAWKLSRFMEDDDRHNLDDR